ncbi:MAG: RluA family pseudouridine synthase [Brevinemataceae bacterium]
MQKLSEFLTKHQEYRYINFSVDEQISNLRIDNAAVIIEPELTRSSLKSLETIAFVNKQESRLSHKLKKGDQVELYQAKSKPISFAPEKVEFGIIYQDNDLMVIDKPWNLVVHPAKGHESGTLANGILQFMKEENIDDDFGDEGRIGIVHRLDKDTRGLMLIALNQKSSLTLSNAFKNREITKVYKAVVKGHTPDHGVIEKPIARSLYDRKKMAVAKKGGRDARTDFKVLEYLKEHTLLACKLFTGRTHQIRVHLSDLGYPIVNDGLYSRQKADLPGMGLLACHLTFKHPSTGETMSFTLPDPPEFQQLLEKLR